MAKAKAYNHQQPTVDSLQGSPSQFSLHAGDDPFTDKTDLDSAQDSKKGYKWKGNVVFVNANKIIVRLQCTQGSDSVVLTKKQSAKLTTAGGGLDSGNISITLTDGILVEDVQVDYIQN